MNSLNEFLLTFWLSVPFVCPILLILGVVLYFILDRLRPPRPTGTGGLRQMLHGYLVETKALGYKTYGEHLRGENPHPTPYSEFKGGYTYDSRNRTYEVSDTAWREDGYYTHNAWVHVSDLDAWANRKYRRWS